MYLACPCTATLSKTRLKDYKKILWFVIFIIITINDTTTNITHKLINQYAIYILIFISMCLLSLIILNNTKFKITKVIIQISLLWIIFYGLILSVFFGGFSIIKTNELIYICISILFFILTIEVKNENINLIYYIIVSLVLLILSGSLNFENGINIDFIMQKENYRDYSQGFSFVYSMFSLFLFNEFVKNKKIIYLLLFIICFFLVVLGAARGEFIALIAVVFIISLKNNYKKTLIFTLLIIMTSVYVITKMELENELLLIYRIGQIDQNNLGLRDILWIDGYKLLLNDVSFFGNGFNYFQKYYNYSDSMYPHNILLELMIAYGVFGLLISILMVIGCVNLYKKQNTINIITLYIFLVLLKSGSLFNFFSFWVISLLVYNAIELLNDLNDKKYNKV